MNPRHDPEARRALSTVFVALLIAASPCLHAQITFSSAISLALQNSPRVKLAQDDIHHAQAVLDEAHDAYIPRLSAGAGLGDAYGITLTIPTIFTFGAQSLLFSYAQRDYIRAARLELEAAARNLEDAQNQVIEDTVVTYISIDHAQQLQTALADQQAFAEALSSIVEQRGKAGLESPQDVHFAARTVLQIRLQSLLNEDESANLREHLSQLIGLHLQRLTIVPNSIPPNEPSAAASSLPPAPDPPFLLSAQANAQAKLERAFGDARFAWRPQIGLEFQYGRISPIVDVTSYYNIQGNYNTLSGGLVFQIPFLDAGRKARARQSAADASHAFHDVARLRGQQSEDSLRLQHTLAELQVRLQLADLEQSIAQDQLKTVLIELQTGGYAGPPRTPAEEQNARLHERQTYIDLLNARLELRRAQIFLLRQTGQLRAWAFADPQADVRPVRSPR